MSHRMQQKAVCEEFRSLYASDCQRCGLCCIYYAAPFHINLFPGEERTIPRKLVQIGPRNYGFDKEKDLGVTRYLRIKPDPHWPHHNRCAALQGMQLREARCSIYSNRPFACSDFDAGSAKCLQIRAWGGAEIFRDGLGIS